MRYLVIIAYFFNSPCDTLHASAIYGARIATALPLFSSSFLLLSVSEAISLPTVHCIVYQRARPRPAWSTRTITSRSRKMCDPVHRLFDAMSHQPLTLDRVRVHD